MLRRAALVLCLACPAAALAAPATPEEAARLTSLFETYVGRPAAGASPIVTVTPDGESYKAAFDLTRMAAPLHSFGIDVVVASPYVATLTPRADGTWRVQREGLPQFGFTTRKGLTYSVQFLSKGSDAIFDPKIEAFAHQENQLGGSKTSVTSDTKAKQHSEIIEDGKQVIDAKGPGPQEVSSVLRQEDKAIHYRSHIDSASKSPAGAPTGDTSLDVTSALTQASASNERVGSLLDLWAFLVAHPSRDQLAAEQPKLKSLALAMIPYVTAFTGRSEGQGVSVRFGQDTSVAIGTTGEAVAYDSSSTTEGLSLSMKMTDLQVETSALPKWVVAALPHRIDLQLATSPLDVGKALRVLVDKADLSKDDPMPPDAMALAMTALAPNGGPTLAVKPSTLDNGTLTLAILGAFSSTGKGKARIEAAGLDQQIAAVSAAGPQDPMASQAVQVLSLAKALAAPQPDGRLLWEIVLDNNGLTINGRPLQ